jgi:uncharacterized protein YbjQ (UPF0145 family)
MPKNSSVVVVRPRRASPLLICKKCLARSDEGKKLKRLLSRCHGELLTSAMYEAREIAIERMQFEAAAAKAEGLVGVDIHEGSHGWLTHVIEFFAIGTAVLPLDQEIAPEKIQDLIMVLSVND